MTGPRLGCGAAIIRDDRILLAKRIKDPEAGHWGLIGGKVERGETVEQAVCREAAEEVGVAITLSHLLCVVDQIEPDAHWVAPVYLATIAEGEPRLCEPQALSEMGWFSLDRLPEPLTLATRTALPHLWAAA